MAALDRWPGACRPARPAMGAKDVPPPRVISPGSQANRRAISTTSWSISARDAAPIMRWAIWCSTCPTITCSRSRRGSRARNCPIPRRRRSGQMPRNLPGVNGWCVTLERVALLARVAQRAPEGRTPAVPGLPVHALHTHDPGGCRCDLHVPVHRAGGGPAQSLACAALPVRLAGCTRSLARAVFPARGLARRSRPRRAVEPRRLPRAQPGTLQRLPCAAQRMGGAPMPRSNGRAAWCSAGLHRRWCRPRRAGWRTGRRRTSTGGNPRPCGMPPFSHLLTDDQVAAVATHVRTSWGNQAAPVSLGEVLRYR